MPHQFEDGPLPSQDQVPGALEPLGGVRVKVHVNILDHLADNLTFQIVCYIYRGTLRHQAHPHSICTIDEED